MVILYIDLVYRSYFVRIGYLNGLCDVCSCKEFPYAQILRIENSLRVNKPHLCVILRTESILTWSLKNITIKSE